MSQKTIEVFLNSEPEQLPHSTRLSEALEKWQSESRIGDNIACAVNGDFVPRSAYPDTLLASGDLVDVVQPVGGG